jgi:hypothetical protein
LDWPSNLDHDVGRGAVITSEGDGTSGDDLTKRDHCHLRVSPNM